jgi:hypothetical protein
MKYLRQINKPDWGNVIEINDSILTNHIRSIYELGIFPSSIICGAPFFVLYSLDESEPYYLPCLGKLVPSCSTCLKQKAHFLNVAWHVNMAIGT